MRRRGWVGPLVAGGLVGLGFAEIWLVGRLGAWIGFLGVALVMTLKVVAAVVIGGRQLRSGAARLTERLRSNHPDMGPQLTVEAQSSLLLVAGCAMLALPALATSAVGALLCVPPVRRAIAGATSGRTPAADTMIVPGEVVGERPDREPPDDQVVIRGEIE